MKHDYNLLLRLPRQLKSAIEKKVGPGSVSDFIRHAAEEKVTSVCTRCKGTGKILRLKRGHHES